MPFNGKITVELKGEMTTAGSLDTIKVFYHPLTVVAKVEKAAGSRLPHDKVRLKRNIKNQHRRFCSVLQEGKDTDTYTLSRVKIQII